MISFHYGWILHLLYSSAIFEKQKDDLFSAQLNKYKKLTVINKAKRRK